MGNCCGGGETEVDPRAFQGQGQRLGSANEATAFVPSGGAMERDDSMPKPVIDRNLNDDQRAKLRADRAAAAEARLKKQGGPPKKKKPSSDAPLTGPNSKPLMRWTAG